MFSRENLDKYISEIYGITAEFPYKENGIYPAYHMNKSYWISVLLDGTVDDEKLKYLLDISFDLTNSKIRNKRKITDGQKD